MIQGGNHSHHHEGSVDDTATEKTQNESPSKHRKIIRGFAQSKSTKILPPNTVQLDKPLKPQMNNMTIMTETSEAKKNNDIASSEKQTTTYKVTNVKQMTLTASHLHT